LCGKKLSGRSFRKGYSRKPSTYDAGLHIRDKIAHCYFGIDYEIVWQVAKEKLPYIRPALEKMLKDLKAKEKALK